MDDIRKSDRYFRDALKEQLLRQSEHSNRLHELLDFRTAAQADFRRIDSNVHTLQRVVEEKAERRSLQDAQQLIAKLTFHKADRRAVAELQRLLPQTRERLSSPLGERYQMYADRLRQARVQRVLHIGPAPAEWLEVLHENYFSVQAEQVEAVEQLSDSTFQAITCLGVIEHLPFGELVRLLDETLRLLQPYGLALLETANPLAAAESMPPYPILPNTLAGLAELRGFDSGECSFFGNAVTWIGHKRGDV